MWDKFDEVEARFERLTGDLGNPELSGENAKPMGDGIANLLRYALGAGSSTAVQLPQFTRSGGSLSFRFRYDPSLFDLIYQVEASDDAGNWSNPVRLFDSSASALQPDAEGWLSVTDPTPPAGRRFYRLRVLRLTE